MALQRFRFQPAAAGFIPGSASCFFAAVTTAAALFSAAPTAGQDSERPTTGLKLGGVPAINFDADEGFGYGLVGAFYQYGDGSLLPYRWSLQPTLFFTTEGRRDLTAFFDAPELIGRWRVSVFAGSEEQLGTPWYGEGNDSEYDPDLETEADPWYYRFGRTRRSLLGTFQRPIGDSPARLLLGAGVVHGDVTEIPEGEGTTLLAGQVAQGRPLVEGWVNHLRVGVIWDTRDRETNPRRGAWSEFLVQRVDEAFGSEASYTRWTAADRRYYSFGPVVFAHRLLLQRVSRGVPLMDLHRVQTSLTDQEGMGGSKSVRGVLRNRYIGRGLFIWNTELRWRAADFDLVGRSFHVVLSGFADAGRVWTDSPEADEIFSDLHRGWGGGVRVGMGPDFTVAMDAGTSAETGVQIYIGLGYLF